MRVNNLKELEGILKKKIQKTLETEVKDTLRDIVVDHIFTDVYDSYAPNIYRRRQTQSGANINSPFDNTSKTGLLDPNNLKFTFDGKGGISVQNVAVGSKYYFSNGKTYISKNAGLPIANVIETGNGYDSSNWEYDGVPRPFMKNSYMDLKVNHYHTQALKLGLQEQGLEVR